MISLRPYEPPDRLGYLALQEKSFGEPAAHNDPAATLDRVRSVATSVVFVAERDGEIVGTAIGGYDGCRGWLYAVAVDPDARRCGLGSRLVTAVEDALASRGCPKVNLQVRAENAAVVAFYESLGYCVEERVSLGKRLNG